MALHNVHQNVSFVKVFNVVVKKMARNGYKMAIYESYIFFFFLTKLQKNGRKKMFNGIGFDLIKIIRSLKASQNDLSDPHFCESYLCSW